MAKIVTVRFKLAGIRPLLMNPMANETKDDIEKGRTSPKSRATAKDLAAAKVIRDPDGHPALRDDHVYECLVSAGRDVPWKGLQRMTSSKPGIPSKIYSFLELVDPWYPITNDTPGEEPTWAVDKRPTPTQTGQRVMAIRPRFSVPWSIEGQARIDTTDVSVGKVREVYDKAGRMFGLGSYRGRFGLFRVEEWEIVSVEGEDDPAAEEGKKGGKRTAKAAA